MREISFDNLLRPSFRKSFGWIVSARRQLLRLLAPTSQSILSTRHPSNAPLLPRREREAGPEIPEGAGKDRREAEPGSEDVIVEGLVDSQISSAPTRIDLRPRGLAWLRRLAAIACAHPVKKRGGLLLYALGSVEVHRG